MIKKILIVTANPADTDRLRLDKEVHEIKEGLRRAKHREQFNIVSEWAVSFNDLRRALLDHEPQIVHFSGHGEKNGIILEGELGISVTSTSKAISRLFELFSQHVECVILNACYSAPQASAINRHINYVIGMPGKINDKAAIEFSVGFYDALGAGKTIDEAFDFGCNAFHAANIPKKFSPRLYKKKSVHFLPKISGSLDIPTKFPTTTHVSNQIIHIEPKERFYNTKLNITNEGNIIHTETNYYHNSNKKKRMPK